MITQTINLNLIPGGVLPRIKVSQYDKGSRVLQFNLFNGSSAFTIPVDASITIQGTKADNTGFQYACTFSGSTVTADLEQQMTVFPGEVECEIRISQDDGDVLLGTCNFILDVEEAALQDDIIISETELPLVEKAAEAADVAEASALDAEAWAVGQRDGEDVPNTDPAYHNNSKYYAETVPTLLTNYYMKSETYSKGEIDTALGGKQDTLTFDDSPTSASSNPVKSGGVYTALAGKVNTEAGKGLSANDFTNAEKAKTDNAVLWSERKGYVGKNLMPCDLNGMKNINTTGTWNNNVYTKNGITFTVNSDGSVTIDGTAITSTANLVLFNNTTTNILRERILNKEITISGAEDSPTNDCYFFFYNFNGQGNSKTITSSGLTFTFSNSSADFNMSIAVTVGTVVDNLTFYPMIRLSSISDNTYEPYLPSNEELVNSVLLSTDTELSSSAITTLTISDSIQNYKRISVIGYKGSDGGGNRFSFVANVDILKGNYLTNSAIIYIINDTNPYVVLIEVDTDLKMIVRKFDNSIGAGFHIKKIIGYKS